MDFLFYNFSSCLYEMGCSDLVLQNAADSSGVRSYFCLSKAENSPNGIFPAVDL